MPRRLILYPCSHLGNLLIALPHLRAMLTAHPHSLLVVNDRYRAIIATALPGETRLLYYPESGLSPSLPLWQRARHYLRFILALRRFRAEICIDIEGEQKSATLSRLSGAGRRLGVARKHGQWFYTEQQRQDHSGHSWLRYASVSHPAAAGPASYLPMTPSPQGEQEIAALLEGQPPQRRLLIHAGATKSYKMWHPEQFAALCQQARRAGLTPLLIGAGERDHQQNRRIQRFLNDPVEDLCDRLSLHGLIALFGHSHGYVGNDSGPMHLAAACGLPTVGLFGPTDDQLWQPLSARARVLRWQPCASRCQRNSCALDSYPCLQRITVDQVLDSLAELGVLSRRPGHALLA